MGVHGGRPGVLILLVLVLPVPPATTAATDDLERGTSKILADLEANERDPFAHHEPRALRVGPETHRLVRVLIFLARIRPGKGSVGSFNRRWSSPARQLAAPRRCHPFTHRQVSRSQICGPAKPEPLRHGSTARRPLAPNRRRPVPPRAVPIPIRGRWRGEDDAPRPKSGQPCCHAACRRQSSGGGPARTRKPMAGGGLIFADGMDALLGFSAFPSFPFLPWVLD
ncbi:hypothetical protein PVAP13_8NG195603 [Panicum virgatum]|uniref:Uncharacterized protein n=1 Tax=Panicum virgatum TaxID=38727 RepID=A0A8T0P343_PANVG|nr:hypothetical protein PVAP13_8NG195603 [Panicum virgatum]